MNNYPYSDQVSGYHNQPNVYISPEENLLEDQLVSEPYKANKISNHDLPLSGVGQTLQNFLSNTYLNSNQSIQNTANFNSIQQPSIMFHDNSSSIQEQLFNIQSYDNSSQQLEDQSMEKGRNNYQANHFNPHAQQQRSLSQGQGNNFGGIGGNKQVRFTIKDGLKNLIEESNIDIESVASRGEQIQKQNFSKKQQQQRPLPSQMQQRTSPQRQNAISKSKSPKTRKQDLERSNSQQRKNVSYKSRKLALKYKREADESRKKKLGDLADLANMDDLSQVPDFNEVNPIITGRSQYDKTPEEIQSTPPKPSQRPQIQLANQQQMSNQNKIIQQNQFDTFKNQSAQKEPIHNNSIINQSQLAGCIVKRNDLSRNRNEMSNNLTKQPGTIMRRRSTSPADNLSLGRNKENTSMNMNTSILIGQIVKLQNHNQQLNQSSHNAVQNIIPQQNLLSPKITQGEQKIINLEQMPTNYQYGNIGSQVQKVYDTPQFDQTQQLATKESKQITFLYKTVWESLDKPMSEVINKFEHSMTPLNNIRNQMLHILSQTPRGSSFLNIDQVQKTKIRFLRTSLIHLYIEKFRNNIQSIVQLRDRRLIKIQDLKRALKSNGINNQLLKIELLRDIISRLQQKIVFAILRLNKHVRIEVSTQFQAYYSEFIIKDYLSTAFNILRKNQQKRSQKNEYMYIVREQVHKIKLTQLYNAWKNIKQYKEILRTREIKSRSILLSRKILRVIQSWKISIIQTRNIQLGQQIAKEKQKLKYHQQLFLKWVYSHRSSSKIKRKALLMVSPSTKGKDNIRDQINDDEWFNNQLTKIQSSFNVMISEYLLEREHNRTFIQSLKFKLSIQELNIIFPLRFEQDSEAKFKRNDFTNAYKSNCIKIYQQYPELRKKTPVKQQKGINRTFSQSILLTSFSNQEPTLEQQFDKPHSQTRRAGEIDVDLKYSIHSALVYHQNNQTKNQSMIIQDQSLILKGTQLSGKKDAKKQNQKAFLPPPPRRLIEIEQENQQKNEINTYAPNQIFRKLQDQLNQVSQSMPNVQSSSVLFKNQLQNILPLTLQLRDHIKALQFKLNQLKAIDYNYHFKQSLIVNSSDVIQDDMDQFNGLTDYIQYGISCDQYRMVFLNMFKTKAISVLMTQWKTRYVEKQLDDDLQSLHILNISKQSFIEWSRVIKARKLKIKDFHRTMQIQKFYRIFQKWADWNKQVSNKDKSKVRQFRLKTIFKNWIKYLDSQGQNLMKIIRSQQYYKQALMSKSLLSLYQSYLRQLRIKRFQRKIAFKKFFQKAWIKQFKRIQVLKKLLMKIQDRVILNERLKYQREFELKRETLSLWNERVNDKKRLIQHYTALTHYRQNLIFKSFMAFKKDIRLVKGLFQLQKLTWKYRLYPVFQMIKHNTQTQKLTESNFQDYRMNYLKAEVFNKLRQNQVESKLAKLFMKKRVFKAWQTINYRRNHDLPLQYRAQKVQQAFIQVLKHTIRQKWAQERSYIIQKNLIRDREMKIKKLIFLKFLENILIEKKQRIIYTTVYDFRKHYLMGKVFKTLKQSWSENNRDQLMNRVAKDFYCKIIKRRDLKRRQYYESKGINYKEEGQISKHRVFTAWRMYIEHKLTKNMVLRRFLEFKRRFKMLRSFLAWRSYARYENTPSHHNPSRDRFIYESSHKNPSTPSYNQSNNYDLPLQTQSPQISTRQSNFHIHNNNMTHLGLSDHKSQKFNIMPHSTTGVSNLNIIGDQDLTQIRFNGETPMKPDYQGPQQDKSLFDELENIFQKNKKWLDEQREREDFLREMASHYNQRLSQEMNTLRYQSLSSTGGGAAYRSNTNFN